MEKTDCTVHESNGIQHGSCDLEIAVNNVCNHSHIYCRPAQQLPSPVCVFNLLDTRNTSHRERLSAQQRRRVFVLHVMKLILLDDVLSTDHNNWVVQSERDGEYRKSLNSSPCVCDLEHTVQTAATTLQLGSRYIINQFSRY